MSTIAIRAILKLRNESMLAARERFGLSQPALAKLAKTTTSVVSRLERLKFPTHRKLGDVARIAAVLSLTIEDILPEKLIGKTIDNYYETTTTVQASRLLEGAILLYKSHNILESPEAKIERDEIITLIKNIINAARKNPESETDYLWTGFSPKMADVLFYRFIQGLSIIEITHIMKEVSRQRIDQLWKEGIKRLKVRLIHKGIEDMNHLLDI